MTNLNRALLIVIFFRYIVSIARDTPRGDHISSIPYTDRYSRLFFKNKYDNLNHLIAICVVYILKTLFIFVLENYNNNFVSM